MLRKPTFWFLSSLILNFQRTPFLRGARYNL
jgi:hypothetical protein